MPEIVGVTYPISKQFMDRFFKGKEVFIKPATVWKQLKPGMKFVFYQSREDTGFVGEAKIKRVVLSEDPTKFYETYGDRIFLTKEELKEYIKSQELLWMLFPEVLQSSLEVALVETHLIKPPEKRYFNLDSINTESITCKSALKNNSSVYSCF